MAFVIGFGLGWTAAPTLIVAHASVGWGERGAVTGMNTFARSAGSAVGVAVYGAISNALVAAGAGEHDPATVVHASTGVFIAAAVTALLVLAAVYGMPKDRAEQYSGASGAGAGSDSGSVPGAGAGAGSDSGSVPASAET